MSFLWRGALRRPVVVLALGLLPVMVLALQARRLVLEPGIDLLPAGDPIAHAEKMRRETFGDDFRLLVAIVKPYGEGGAVSVPSRQALVDLHGKLEALPGIRRVSSLINAPVLVASPGAAVGEPVWGGVGAEGQEVLTQRLSASELGKFMFLSALWEVTPLYLETDARVPEAELVHDIQRLIRETEVSHPQAGRLLLVGAGLVETSLAGHIFDDLNGLIPFAVGMVALGLLLAVRRASLLIIAVLHCLVLVLMVLGGMAAFGISVNLVSVLAPVILIPVGVADLLHLFVRLRSGVEGRGSPTEAGPVLASAFSHLQRAMIGTSATTALGFLGFLISPIAAIRQFGLTMSAGAVLALLLTFTLDAALLSLFWRPRARAPKRRRLTRIERALWSLATSETALRRQSRRAMLIWVVLAVSGLLVLTRLHIDDTWIQNFDPGSRITRDTRLFEKLFVGTNLLSVVVKADTARPETRDAAIELANDLGSSFFFAPGVQGALSAPILARSFDPEQGKPWTPWPSPAAEELDAALDTWERQGPSLPRVGMLASPDRNRFQVLFFVLNQPYADLVRLVDTIRDWSLARATELGVTVSIGGDLVSNIRMVRLAVLGQTTSLLTLLAVLSVLIGAVLRSLRATVALLAPMVLAIVLTYAVLVALRIPYGVAVSMFPTLVIGLAIDFGIHLRAAMVRNRHASRRRWVRDLAVVIRGIVLNGTLWTAGFAVLTFSSLPPNRFLGLLCSIVVTLSTIATLLLLPTARLASMTGSPRSAVPAGA